MTIKKFFSLNDDVKEGWSLDTTVYDRNGLFIESMGSDKAVEKYGNRKIIQWCIYDEGLHIKIK